MSFLSKESVINCNSAELLSKTTFQKRISPKHGIQVIERNVPASLKKQIIKAIQDSPVVKRYIKKLVKN